MHSPGRRVLVTGASGGIGEALARALPNGNDLLLTGRDETRLKAIGADIARDGRQVDTVTADLSSDGGEALVAAARATPLEGLVNNAGVAPAGRFVDAAPGELAAAVDVNCRAMVTLTRALLPHLLATARRTGRRSFLINVASTAAYAPVPQLAVYAASKAFVLSFTEALATELRREPIDVLALCPGPTRTAALPFRGLPGTRTPADVARIALDAVGRVGVAYTDGPTRLALGPLTRARATVGRMLDLGLARSLRA